MTESRFRRAAQFGGTLVVIAVIVLTGCQHKSEPAAEVSSTAIASSAPTASAAGALKVAVSLSPAMAKKTAPGDTVFVFARTANGPRMPLAVVRKQVRDLPATIVLDDSLAMNPEIKLSSAPEVIIVARVSKSGDAIAQAGDLEGTSGPVKPGGAVDVSIAKVVSGK